MLYFSLLVFLATTYPHIDVSKQVGIITFYSGQVEAISRELKQEAQKLSDRSLAEKVRSTKVLTVDSFQGSETDIVILSFVRSNARNTVGFLSDFSRINVAITRAKHNLLCIGDAETLQNCKLDYLRSLVADSKARSMFFSSKDIDTAHFAKR
jgi:senataxin